MVRRLFVLIALVLFGVVAAPTGAATGAPAWAPAATAPIHPGVMTFTNDGQCTANFVFFNGPTVYIGQAAHCSSLGGPTDTDGCATRSAPLGTKVEVGGANDPGTLVYNSWITMQAAHESDADTCAYNDLALVQLSPADAARVNPSIPHWGGPTGISGGAANLTRVYSYGNSELRLGVELLSPKVGVVTGTFGNGWSHDTFNITPGIPGDSGSPFLDSEGRAFGILSTIGVGIPTVISNGVGDLNRELAYANSHGFAASLATGTEPFKPSLVPLGL